MPDAAVFRKGWYPGLIGSIAAAHARYYAEHWNFGAYFEAKVARECAAFAERAEPTDLCLSAWHGAEFAGSLVLDCHDLDAPDGYAHLRWFIVTRQGQALGRQMMDQAIAFLDDQKLPCFLTTFAGLDAARHLYETAGFVLTDQCRSETWGIQVEEQRFERQPAA